MRDLPAQSEDRAERQGSDSRCRRAGDCCATDPTTTQGCRLFNILRRYPFDREEKADRQLIANGPYFPADNNEQQPHGSLGPAGRAIATYGTCS